MVKKYFRPIIRGVCVAMSIFLAGNTLSSAYVLADNVDAEPAVFKAVGTSLTESEAISEIADALEMNESESIEDEIQTELSSESESVESKSSIEEKETDISVLAGETTIETESGEWSEKIALHTISGENTTDNEKESDMMNEAENNIQGESNGESESEIENASENESDKESESKSEQDSESILDIADNEANGASISYDKDIYNHDETITVTIDNAVLQYAKSATVQYDFPDHTSFVEIVNRPSFKEGSCQLIYKNTEGEWNDYTEDIDANQVSGIGYKANSESGICQDNALTFSLTASQNLTTETNVKTEFSVEDTTIKKTNTSTLIVEKVSVELAVSQTPQNPSKADLIVQNVSVIYKDSVDSKIIYEIDPSLTIQKIDVGSNTFLEGGTAIITSASGETSLPITASIDLLGYANVSKIIFIPKITALEGMEANFSASLLINKDVESISCKASVIIGTDGNQKTISKNISSNVLYCVVEKPVILYENKQVSIGDSFTIGLDGFGMKAYGLTGIYEYTIQTPDFVQIDKLKLPKITGSLKMELYFTTKNGESYIGEFQSGSNINIGKTGISNIRIAITPEQDMLQMDDVGSLIMSNLDKNNKDNYHGFRIKANMVCGDSSYSNVSKIIGVTFEIYKPTEIDKPQTNDPVSPIPPVETPDEPVENEPIEKPEDNTMEEEKKAAEKARKDAILKEMLQEEQKQKDIKKAILSSRINTILSSTLSTKEAAGSDSTQTVNSYESDSISSISQTNSSSNNTISEYLSLEIPPIDESIISDLTITEVFPINLH